MKNSLVDALRQAGAQAESSDASRTAEAEHNASHDGGDADLALAHEPAPLDAEARDVRVDASETLSLEPSPTDSHAPLPDCPELDGDETCVLPALELAPDDDTIASSPETLPLEPSVYDVVARLARWSPLLYVVGVSVAVASFAGYQQIVGRGASSELGNVASPANRRDAPVRAASSWQALPETDAADGQAVTVVAPERPVARRALQTPPEPPPVSRPSAVIDAREAYKAYGRGDYALAERRYQRLLTEDPYHVPALMGLAAVLERTGRGSQTAELYERVLTAEPQNAGAAAALVSSARTADHRFSVETQLKLLLQRHPEASVIKAALGTVYAGERRWPEAYAAFAGALEGLPGDADVHYNAAISAERSGKTTAARLHYAAALEQASPNAAFSVTDVARQLERLTDNWPADGAP